MLESARAEAEAAGAVGDALDAEIRIAECVLTSGKAAEALEILERCEDRMSTHADAGQVTATFHRIRGAALALLGDSSGAREALDQSLRVARERNSSFDLALTLRVRGRVLGPDAVPGDVEASRWMLESLGVVYVADVPAPRPAASVGA